MMQLQDEATATVLGWGDGWHRTVALHHAALHHRPGLVGDHPVRPSSVLWLRDGGDQWEAFAAGLARPALDWLEWFRREGRPVVLAAPESWTHQVQAQLGQIETKAVQTWLRPGPGRRARTGAGVRPLTGADAAAFAALAPGWAVRAWGDFATAIDQGAAFGVPGRSGLIAAAWVVESDDHADKVGVVTDPCFRRLGLGQAVAAALLDAIERDRARQALWVVNPANGASLALAQRLGFAPATTETLFRWVP